jgi:hypothetical protein
VSKKENLTILQQWKRGFRLYGVVSVAILVLYLPLIFILSVLQSLGLEPSSSIGFLVAWLILVPVFGLVVGPVVIYRVAEYFEVSISEHWNWKNKEKENVPRRRI